ncbi:DUF6765 family protein [Clostridium transplantifaecale]|uniref:DUF6765 family protein n=1 Tax=Clostridium transplantifaecale TaxID=2479838 RepID=UPI000F62C461|nr:DUF6765 family protein [Clostridium transplantifaecale]
MKQAYDLSEDKLEQELRKQAITRGGFLELDFSDPLHYEFYVNSFGGEERLKGQAPVFYGMLQERRACDLLKGIGPEPDFLYAKTKIPLEDYSIVSNIDTQTFQALKDDPGSNDEPAFYHRIKGTLEASYSSRPVAVTHIKGRIKDCDTGQYIQEKSTRIYPDKDCMYSMNIDVNVPDKKYKREHPYRTTGLFTAMAPLKDGNALMSAQYASSLTYTVSSNDDIMEIQRNDPRIINAASRSKYKNEICISYQRSGILESPDYPYSVDLEHVIKDMPVYLDLSFTVELRNGAYFKPDARKSYFFKDSDPQIYLSRFNNETEEVIAEGRALLFQDWISFTDENVKVIKKDKNQNATKLELTFPKEWKANLHKEDFLDTGTFADFYAMVSFNTCNKDSQGIYYDEATTIFIRFLTEGDDRSNPTKPGINSVHVPRLYYQWGCFGEDTLLEGENGPLQACEVKLHDRLKSRDGSLIEVEDVLSGNEPEILHISHEKGSICLTPDHTLFGEDAAPMAAADAVTGTKLLYLDPETGKEILTAVMEHTMVPYGKKVYNFRFSKPEYLIANGLLAGDFGWQQKIRPNAVPISPRLENARIRQALDELDALNGPHITAGQKKAPDPVFSNQPECLSLHYYALKALATHNGLYSDEDAQTIAEYCQYLADNATTGGLRVQNIPAVLNKTGLCIPCPDETGPAFIIPIIPTAMENWYNDQELISKKPALLPKDPKILGLEYDVPADILAPFHYPPASGENSRTEFDSPYVERLLTAVQKQAMNHGLNRKTLQAMGIALHILLDSMLHEGFSPYHDWQNLGRIQQVIGPDGKDITSNYPPYNKDGMPFPYGEYDENAVYPAGIKENGSASHCSHARYSYIFPLDIGELPMDSTGIPQYSGYQNRVNSQRYVRACKRMMQFLAACQNKMFDDVTWKKILAPVLEATFNKAAETQEDLKTLWKDTFPVPTFEYDKTTVYKRLTDGDPHETSEGKKYDEFFQFTLLLYRLKKGVDLFD